MARILFVSAPLPGHLDWGGYLHTAAELVRQGHTVLWATEKAVIGAVSQAGVPVQAIPTTGWRWPPPPLPATLPAAELPKVRMLRALDTWLSETLVAHGVEALADIGISFQPDVLVTEPFLSAAALVAELLDVPLVVCGWPAEPAPSKPLKQPQASVAAEARARLQRLCQHFNLTGGNWNRGATPFIESPRLHVVYFSRSWYADRPQILPQTHFVGGWASPPAMAPPDWLAGLPDDRLWVFITLGSAFINDPSFFVNASHAATQVGAIPIISTGRSNLASKLKAQLRPHLPVGSLLLDWVDYGHLFPKLAAAIHHGGVGTTHAAILHGLPQLIVPHAADQFMQARRATLTGVGLSLRAQEATPSRIAEALTRLLQEPHFRERATSLQAEFAALGGIPRAAELIINVRKR